MCQRMMMQNRKEGEDFPISLERTPHVFIFFLLMPTSGYYGFTPPLCPHLVPRPVSNVLQDLSPEREGVTTGMSWPNDDGRVTAPFVRKRWETDVAFSRTTEKPAASQLARHLYLDVVLAWDRQRPVGSRHCNAKLLHAVTPASSGSVSLCGWDYLISGFGVERAPLLHLG